MKIDELISELEQVKEEHGNLEVVWDSVMSFDQIHKPKVIDLGDGKKCNVTNS